MSNLTPIEELTFVLREAPTRSAYAGQLCAEVRTTTKSQKIIPVLKSLGLLDDEQPKVNILEKWTHPAIGWKLLRFSASPEVYRQLHELCSPSDIEDIARLTDAHMAELSQPAAYEEMIATCNNKELTAIAKHLPGFDQLGKRPSKRKLAEFIINMSDATIGKPIAA